MRISYLIHLRRVEICLPGFVSPVPPPTCSPGFSLISSIPASPSFSFLVLFLLRDASVFKQLQSRDNGQLPFYFQKGSVKHTKSGSGEMAQLVKGLPSKHAIQVWILSTHVKFQGQLFVSVILVLGGQRWTIPGAC